MFPRKRMIATGAVAVPLAAALAAGLFAGPASADPASGTHGTYAAMGSDTIQDVMNRLSTVVTSSSGHTFESWNAVNPTTQAQYDTITPKGNASLALKRPDGSGDGIASLRLSYSLNTPGDGYTPTDSYNTNHGPVPHGSVDIARSSRGPSDKTDASLTWIPFAVDAVDYAVKSGSEIGASASGPTLSITDLTAIYHCTFGPTGNNVLADGTRIQPYVPQPGSGTRSFFESSVGITDANVTETAFSGTSLPSSCTVLDHKLGTGASVQEHNGQVLTDPTIGSTKIAEVVPISVAQNIAQGNSLATGVTDLRGNSVLGTLTGGASGSSNPKNSNGTLNPNFAFHRNVFNVVPTATLNQFSPQFNADFVNMFVGASSKLCQQTSVITLFGFAQVPAGVCGSTSTTGKD